MGMTIDVAIEHGKEQLEVFGGEHKEFIVCALDTMQKYQKIEQIVKQYKKFGNIDFSMQIISGVVGDGKVD